MTTVLDAVPVAAHEASASVPALCSHRRCGDLRVEHEFVACAELPGSGLIATVAREFVGHMLCAWGCWVLLDRAVRVISELATNALLHGQVQESTIARVYRDAQCVWFEIDDRTHAEPQVRLPGALIDQKVDGWGLFLVEALTDRFGWRIADGIKTVFACWSMPVAPPQPDRLDAHDRTAVAPGLEKAGS
jgi:anti-sigma regulatory factor (Ser/Thr protein kinase)